MKKLYFLTLSVLLAYTVHAQNLLTNGDFNAAGGVFTGWDNSSEWIARGAGGWENSAHVFLTSGGGIPATNYLAQAISLTPGTAYEISLMYKNIRTSSSNQYYVRCGLNSSATQPATFLVEGTQSEVSWDTISVNFTAQTGNDYLVIWGYSDNNNDNDFRLENVVLKEVTTTGINDEADGNIAVWAYSGQLHVTNQKSYSGVIKVMDISGQLIISKVIQPGTNVYDLPQKGIFIAKTVVNGVEKISKVVVK